MAKFLNVIIDGWDHENNIPKKNGLKYFEDFKLRNIQGLFDFYEFKEYKYFTLKEIPSDTNENYYYFFSYVLGMNNYLESENLLDKKVIKKIKEDKRVHLVFMNEHDPDSETMFHQFLLKLRDLQIPENQVILINHNLLLNEYKLKYESDIEVNPTSFLPYFTANNFIRFKDDYEFVSEKRGKFFMCFNRSPKPHRYCLIADLMKNEIIKDVNWSMVNNYNFIEWDKSFIKSFFLSIYSEEEYINNMKEIEQIMKIEMKKSDYEIEKNWFGKNVQPNCTDMYEFKSYQNSYVNIVTESEFFDNSIFITEKSMIPFFFYQIPIIISSHNHIKYMKKKYGFDFFDDIIDHGYDEEFDNRKRFKSVKKTIQDVYNNRDKVKKFFIENKKRLLNNQKIVLDIVKNKEDINFFKKLIKKNELTNTDI